MRSACVAPARVGRGRAAASAVLGIGRRWACWKAEAGFAGCGRCASELTETLRVLLENLTRFQHYASYKYQIKYPKHQIFTADTWYSAHMMIILSHISALEFWRSGKEFVLRRPDRFPEVDAIGEGAQNLTSSRIKKLRNQGFEFLSEPTHLLVPSDRVLSIFLRTLHERPMRFGMITRPAATRPDTSSTPTRCRPRTSAWPSPA